MKKLIYHLYKLYKILCKVKIYYPFFFERLRVYGQEGKDIYKRKQYIKTRPQRIQYRPRYQKRNSYTNRRPQKKYYLRRSDARRPFLNRDHHARMYNPDRIYKKKLRCFICDRDDHLASKCPRRINEDTKRSLVVQDSKCCLIDVEDDISDIESIYSIVSIEIFNPNLEDENSEEEIPSVMQQYLENICVLTDKCLEDNH